jgi:hypothetical protein
MTRKRALSVHDIKTYKAVTLDFTGKWLESIGRPELTGSWIIWGNSANGKTRFALQLARYLATFTRVAYNSLEEGMSLSMKKAILDTGMDDVARRFILLDNEPIEEMKQRLLKRKSPNVIFVDSLQYSGMRYADYKNLRDEFRNKLFILLSHADGREPKGQVAKSIRYDAMVKIFVEGYKAFPEGRYGGGAEFTIWDKGARDYWEYK